MNELIKQLLDRPIAFNPAFKRLTKNTNAALMLSQACYWAQRTRDPSGWFWKTGIEWESETGLTRWEQETAREILVSKIKVIESKLRGVPARNFYRVDWDRLEKLLKNEVQFAVSQQTESDTSQQTEHVATQQTGMRKRNKQAGGKASNLNPEITSDYAENTTETTTTAEMNRADEDGGGGSPDPFSSVEELTGIARALALLGYAPKSALEVSNMFATRNIASNTLAYHIAGAANDKNVRNVPAAAITRCLEGWQITATPEQVLQLPDEILLALAVEQPEKMDWDEYVRQARENRQDETQEETAEICHADLGGERADKVWKVVLESLSQELPRASFQTWVADTYPVAWDPDKKHLAIACMNDYAAEWIQNKLSKDIQGLIEQNCGIKNIRLQFQAGAQ